MFLEKQIKHAKIIFKGNKEKLTKKEREKDMNNDFNNPYNSNEQYGYNGQNGYNYVTNSFDMSNEFQQNQSNINNAYIYQNVSQNDMKSTNDKKGKRNKKGKVKKKRKHRFLKFLLFNIILICTIVFGRKFMNNLAKKEFDTFCPNVNSIFSFENEEDSIYYVTDNFSVPTNYTQGDKTYNITWSSSNNKYVIFNENGEAIITRPSNKSVKIILTQTYKKFFGLGKAEKYYEVILIPTNTINGEDIKLVTKEEMETKSYKKEMEMSLDENGQIDYIYGDFDNTYVYSKEDALLVLEKYREELEIDEKLEFECNTIDKSIATISYTLNAKYNGVPLNYDNVQIIVDSDNFEIIKIVNNISTTIKEEITKNDSLNIEDIISKYIEKNNLTTSEYKISVGEEEFLDGTFVIRAYVSTNENFYELIVELNNGEVINCVDLYTINALFEGVRYETTTGSGKNLKGENLTFPISIDKHIDTNTKKYVMYDKEKNIMCYEYLEGNDALLKNMKEGGDDIYNLAAGFYSTIASNTNEFNNPLAIDSYLSMRKVYDMYYNQLNWNSWNNHGDKLKVVVNHIPSTNGAAWTPIGNMIVVGPNQAYRDNVISDIKVLTHEYTHGVFQKRTNYPYWITGEEVVELKSINESYADTLACLLNGGKDWYIFKNETKDGERLIFRDIENVNNVDCYLDLKYPTTYKGEHWTVKDCHVNSVMLSHIGYEMNSSPLFTRELVRDIWFESMSYGYKKDATFFDFRKNLMQAAEQLGCSKKQLDFIALQFDYIEVFDDSYIITNDEFLTDEDLEYLENKNKDKNTILKTESNAIAGDLIFDDETTSCFLIATSPMGMIFEKAPIMVYQEENGASEQQIEETRQRLEKAINSYIDTLNDTEIPFTVNVTYHQVPKNTFIFLEKVLKKSDSYIRQVTLENLQIDNISDLTNENEDLLNLFFKLVLVWDMKTTTAYDFYDSIGILDYVQQ